jgi:hypothetical protein
VLVPLRKKICPLMLSAYAREALCSGTRGGAEHHWLAQNKLKASIFGESAYTFRFIVQSEASTPKLIPQPEVVFH